MTSNIGHIPNTLQRTLIEWTLIITLNLRTQTIYVINIVKNHNFKTLHSNVLETFMIIKFIIKIPKSPYNCFMNFKIQSKSLGDTF